MADPKLDELVFRASTAAPVDPVARLRERMLAGGIVKVAGGGGDEGPGPGPVAIPGMPFPGGPAQRAQGFQAGQGGVQVPAPTPPFPGSLSSSNVPVSMLPARTNPLQGLLQPRSLAQMPGLLPRSPHPAESTRWALDRSARQEVAADSTLSGSPIQATVLPPPFLPPGRRGTRPEPSTPEEAEAERIRIPCVEQINSFFDWINDILDEKDLTLQRQILASRLTKTILYWYLDVIFGDPDCPLRFANGVWKAIEQLLTINIDDEYDIKNITAMRRALSEFKKQIRESLRRTGIKLQNDD